MTSENKKQPINKSDRRRLLIISCGMFFLLGLLVMQFYVIQIVEGDKWNAAAHRQHFFIIDEPFLRGSFYSNPIMEKFHLDEPRKLVLDIKKFHLYADPKSIPEDVLNDVISNLQTTLLLNKQQQESILKQLKKRSSRSRKLVLWLDSDAKEKILNWWYPFARSRHIPRNALFFVSDYERSYPYGKLAGQLLQTVQRGRDEKTGQATPTGGLELSLDRYLRGKKGKRLLMRSPRNVLETGDVIEAPEDGADVYLTINTVLQAIAEDEVGKAVKKANAKTGWAVMMDPYTGEILALAQYPFYDPTNYADYFNDPTRREETKVKAITDAHEPGSVMKPITLAIALLANEELKRRGALPLFDPNEKIATRDGHFPGRRPLKEINYHSYLNMNMGLQKSSNIYMARLIQRVIDRLGKDWYRKQLNEVFGFGAKTNIELPGESAGVLPRPGKTHPNGALEWSLSTPFSLAIGHNVQATSMQLLRAYALLANGGHLVQPTLIKKIVKQQQEGQESEEQLLEKRERSFPKLVNSSTIDPVVTAMKYVTKKGGSAFRADIPGYTECGKTGTAEKIVQGLYSQSDHVVTFIGFAPVINPAFVLLVTIDEPEKGFIPGIGKKHMGGYAAAPVFREIGKRALTYLGITPDDPHGYHVGDPRFDPQKSDWIKNIEALQKQYEEWNGKKTATPAELKKL